MLARQQIRARPARTKDGAVRWRMYDTISVTEKKLQWIEGTTALGRLRGISAPPQPMLDWFAQYMS